MRISTKARYGLAALVKMAEICRTDKNVTIIELSETLKVSKIYLEQVFSLLKRGGFVTSVKGARGGYFLACPAKDIKVYDVLAATEFAVFERTGETVGRDNENIEKAMREMVFERMDNCLRDALIGISIEDIAKQASVYKSDEQPMYYI